VVVRFVDIGGIVDYHSLKQFFMHKLNRELYAQVRLGRDRMVVEFTTTYAISAYHHHSNPAQGEVYSIQQYVIKFVSDLRQVCGFFRVLRFPPPIKLTATI
jgi:hypothetical protein